MILSKQGIQEPYKNDNLSDLISQEIIEPTFDISRKYGEIFIDSFIEDDGLSGIPVLASLRAMYKFREGVSNAYFLKKLFVFLSEYHSGKIEENEVKNFNNKLLNNENHRKKVVEHIIVYLDRVESVEKSKIIANLFLAHTQGIYTWKNFSYLCSALDQLHPKGIKLLKDSLRSMDKVPKCNSQHRDIKHAQSKYRLNISEENEYLNLLTSAGLIFSGLIHQRITTPIVGKSILLTEMGEYMAFYGLGKNVNTIPVVEYWMDFLQSQKPEE